MENVGGAKSVLVELKTLPASCVNRRCVPSDLPSVGSFEKNCPCASTTCCLVVLSCLNVVTDCSLLGNATSSKVIGGSFAGSSTIGRAYTGWKCGEPVASNDGSDVRSAPWAWSIVTGAIAFGSI